jgi:hypothetical protein
MNPTDIDEVPPVAATESAAELLNAARRVLGDIEAVLVRTSPATTTEITAILANDLDNHGGYGLLIDTVQLTASAIDRHLNNH